MDDAEMWFMVESFHPGMLSGTLTVVCSECGSEEEYEFDEDELYHCSVCGCWNEPDRW